MRITLQAPAKLNWTLEVLGHRADGYHEIRTVLQTLDWCDTVTLSEGERLQLRVTGERQAAPQRLQDDLSMRAALALREECGCRDLGAIIDVEKSVPAAAGLGGGSSDGAAVLRGLNVLWRLGLTTEELARVGAVVGSDVPFFIYGGTALAGGRGERVVPLRDGAERGLLIVLPPVSIERKTRFMFDLLRADHFSNGDRTERLVEKIESAAPLADLDLCNAFEAVLPEAAPSVSSAAVSLTNAGFSPHLVGSGPAFFFALGDGDPPAALVERVASLGLPWRTARTLPRAAALAIEES